MPCTATVHNSYVCVHVPVGLLTPTASSDVLPPMEGGMEDQGQHKECTEFQITCTCTHRCRSIHSQLNNV